MTNIYDMSYEELVNKIKEKFDIDFEEIAIMDTRLLVVKILNLEDYIDKLADQVKDGQRLELPFWAKIWPTSILLGYVLHRIPRQKDDSLLEIGAGMGICGLIAAKLGFDVTISDIDEDSLMISQINIIKNNLSENARVKKIDFTRDRLNKKFKYIIGSEVLYRQEHYRPLVKFFLNHMDKDSTVILAKDYHLKAKKFFKLAKDHFTIDEKYIGFKEVGNDKGERHLCSIIRLRLK
ncbi:class I SAM-dependent methyltransferase [Desulfothermus sp.]